MRIYILYTIMAILSLSAVSCASKKQKINFEKQSIFISPGMTKEEVIDVMGIPGDRQFKGGDEAWQYHRNGFWSGYDKIYIVWFYEGVVTGLTSYSYPTSETTAIYAPINWENKPDYILEIRNR